MGNVVIRDELLSKKKNFQGAREGISYHSLLDISGEKEGIVDDENNNNNEQSVKINCDKINGLINMVHDNVMSKKLVLNGPFGRRQCK